MTEARRPPQIEGAVGLTWRPRVRGRWECRWQARTDLVEKGWEPATIRLWQGSEEELTPAIRGYIRDRSNSYQDEMLLWGRGFAPTEVFVTAGAVRTWRELGVAYRTDRDSNFKTLRHATRVGYNVQMGKIDRACGDDLIAETKARHFLRLHEAWSEGGKVTAASATITMVRILANFGATILEDAACKDVAQTLSRMRFKGGRPRGVFLTTDHAIGIRKAAHRRKQPSIAMAQAFQFECIFRQKDCIGEWLPVSEPGISDVLNGNKKWLRGIDFREIDTNFLLSHVTSKRTKLVEIPLLEAPMIVEELMIAYPGCITEEKRIDPDTRAERIVLVPHRDKLPAKGPIVVDEQDGMPWRNWRFRAEWRKCATEAGVPREIKNMDSRAGAISEATDAGAPIEHVRQAATHSQTQQTEQYSRNPAAKTANVLSIRAASRKNKNGT